jgi:hypothetical protein
VACFELEADQVPIRLALYSWPCEEKSPFTSLNPRGRASCMTFSEDLLTFIKAWQSELKQRLKMGLDF